MMAPEQLLIASGEHDGPKMLNRGALERMLHRADVKDRRLMVLSVAGEFSTGKSFLLNFVLSYLNNQGCNEWMAKAADAGFSWKAGLARTTTGILVWPEPLLIGDDIAVILLDSQGTFDKHTSTSDMTFIFALTTVMSSVLICNIPSRLQMDKLQYLQMFVEYGRSSAQTKEVTKIFQKLMFLIRDWRHSKQHGFGLDGGSQYLDTWFNENNSSELAELCATLNECYDVIGCCLLPYPGKKVDNDEDFRGDLSEIEKEFVTEVSAFVSQMLHEDNIVLKAVEGKEIRAGDFPAFVQQVAQQMQDGSLPKPENLVKCMADVANSSAAYEAKKFYEILMDADITKGPVMDFESLHNKANAKTLKFFNKRAKFGGPDLSLKYLEQLQEDIAVRKQEYFNINTNALHKKQEEEILHNLQGEEKWNYIAVKSQQQMHEILGDRSYDIIDIEDKNNILEMKVGFAVYGPPNDRYSEEHQKFIDKMCSKIREQAKQPRRAEQMDGKFGFAAIFLQCVDLEFKTPSIEVVFRIMKGGNNTDDVIFIDKFFRIYKSWPDFLDNNKYGRCWYCLPTNGFYQGSETGTVKVDIEKSPACSQQAAKIADVVSKIGLLGGTGVGIAAMFVPVAGPLIFVATGVVYSSATYGCIRAWNLLDDRENHGQSIRLDNTESICAWLDLVTGPFAFASSITSMRAFYSAGKIAAEIPTFSALIQGASLFELSVLAGDISSKALTTILQLVSLLMNAEGESLSEEVILNLRAQFLFYFHIYITENRGAEVFNNVGRYLHELLDTKVREKTDRIIRRSNNMTLVGKSANVFMLKVVETAQDLIEVLEARMIQCCL